MRCAAWWLVLFACDGPDFTPKHDAAVDAAIDVASDAPNLPVLEAWTEVSSSIFQPAPLDLSCLRAARNDLPTTISVSLAITVRDFQSGNLVPSAQVTAFTGTN